MILNLILQLKDSIERDIEVSTTTSEAEIVGYIGKSIKSEVIPCGEKNAFDEFVMGYMQCYVPVNYECNILGSKVSEVLEGKKYRVVVPVGVKPKEMVGLIDSVKSFNKGLCELEQIAELREKVLKGEWGNGQSSDKDDKERIFNIFEGLKCNNDESSLNEAALIGFVNLMFEKN